MSLTVSIVETLFFYLIYIYFKSLTAKLAADSFNFERVETLGDSYLKFAVSLFLLQEYPTFGEGSLTFLKGKLVGNLNLFYCGKQKNIMGRMNILEFSPLTNFITPAYIVDRRIKKVLPESQVYIFLDLKNINLFSIRVVKMFNFFQDTNSKKNVYWLVLKSLFFIYFRAVPLLYFDTTVDRTPINSNTFFQISPNILYEFRIPQDERFAGQISERTLSVILEKLLSWPVEQNVTLTGIEHFVGTQLVPDKSVSDCVEALIGTYLLVSLTILFSYIFWQ